MLTVVKNSEGEVVFQGYGAFTIETIDIEKEFADFDYKKFIKNIRKEQQDKKIQNRERFERLKRVVEEKGFTLIDDDFLPEYTNETCYGGNMGSVLTLEKDGLLIDIWANGEQRYTVFNDDGFCRILEQNGVRKGQITQESAEKIKKAIYFCMKLSINGILPRYIYFNPVDEILHCEWLTLQDDEKEFLSSLDEDDYFDLYANRDMLPDQLPIGWHVGYYDVGNSNWIEIFFDFNEEQLNEGYVYDGYDFLDTLEEIDELYKLGQEYLEEN